MKNEPSKLSQVAALIGNNAWAASFQSLGQYRTALLKEVARINKAPEGLVNTPPSCDSGWCIARQVTDSAGGDL